MLRQEDMVTQAFQAGGLSGIPILSWVGVTAPDMATEGRLDMAGLT